MNAPQAERYRLSAASTGDDMIKVTAKVVQNVFEVQVGSEAWVARPVIHGTHPIGRRLQALFSTVYTTHKVGSPDQVESTVSYHAKKDEIWIQVGEEKWRTRSSLFGPVTFSYGGLDYTIVEKLIGRFVILRGNQPITQGEIGFRTITMKEYPPEIEKFLGYLGVGYLIRTLAWPA
ncbi:MAG: hypothetical protein L3K07_08085 [Thermoplasmata archaeon]|nr:hypothetical protein [Thermoplasmata archaeon]